MTCACTCIHATCTCACACACACVACACIWGSGRSDQSFIPFQSPTRTFAMSLLYFRFRGLVPNLESTRVDSNSRPCRCLRYDKIRLLGFTTLHDSRRYATPRCLDPSHPDTERHAFPHTCITFSTNLQRDCPTPLLATRVRLSERRPRTHVPLTG